MPTFTNKKVPRSGLYWIITYSLSLSQSGEEEESWILGEVDRTNSISEAPGLFSYMKLLLLRVIF